MNKKNVFQITSVEVVNACIQRIKTINPIVNCLVADRFESALQEARKADEIVQSGSKSVDQLMQETPFLGVPFTAKDSISVKGTNFRFSKLTIYVLLSNYNTIQNFLQNIVIVKIFNV